MFSHDVERARPLRHVRVLYVTSALCDFKLVRIQYNNAIDHRIVGAIRQEKSFFHESFLFSRLQLLFKLHHNTD